ncbi:MAG: DUF2339 domain-containing protein, partial [Chloroflexi bacterium]|nr:DUF2339 domain-containing protein [Chloroflexota bacterium]
AIDRGWLGETERVILGTLFGIALVVAGERNRVRYGIWAQTVGGGGLAILYLAIWGGFALYGLYPTAVAFTLFILITVAGVVLSLRHDSVGLAVLAVFGGFATPLLLQESLPDERVLLAYVLLLDLGVVALAGLRTWRWFTLIAWGWSIILFAFWNTELDPSIGLAQTGISMMFIIFSGATISMHIVRRLPVNEFDLVFLTLNAVSYLLISYGVMFDAYRDWMGGFTALLALFYAALLCGCMSRAKASPALRPLIAALTVGLAALTVPIQLDGAWITVAWSAEALLLVWLSFRFQMRELRWFAYLVFAVSAVWLLAIDTPKFVNEDHTPFLNLPMLVYAAAIALPAIAARLLSLRRQELPSQEQAAVFVFPVWAAFFSVFVIPVQTGGVWVSVAWSLQAVILLALSIRLRDHYLRWFSYLVLAATIVHLVGIDTARVDLESFWPIINWRFLPFATAVASLYTAHWLARRMGDDLVNPWLPDEARSAPLILFGLATFMTLWILSAEMLASADSALFNLSASASENVSILGLTLLWGIYGSVLMVAGVLRRWRWIRVAGLTLLIISVVKLFAYDSQELEQLYRVIAFLALGGILVSGGLLYQRHRDAVRGFLLDD